MAITVGVDTYVEVAYADSYFSTRYGGSAWAGLTTEVKESLLVSATRSLDLYCDWKCDKTDEDQSLEHPRCDKTEVDDNIKVAECEIAFNMYENDDIVNEIDANLKEMKVDVITFKFGGISSTRTIYNDVVARLLKPYCSGVNGKLLTRV